MIVTFKIMAEKFSAFWMFGLKWTNDMQLLAWRLDNDRALPFEA